MKSITLAHKVRYTFMYFCQMLETRARSTLFTLAPVGTRICRILEVQIWMLKYKYYFVPKEHRWYVGVGQLCKACFYGCHKICIFIKGHHQVLYCPWSPCIASVQTLQLENYLNYQKIPKS